MRTFTLSTAVGLPAEAVWQRVITPEGINAELQPFLRMTVPATLRGKSLEDMVTPGMRVGRSWLLLFGVLPIDFDDIGVAAWEPGRRFVEQSTMLSMRAWRHERMLLASEPGEAGCTVRDDITFALRAPTALVPGLEAAMAWLLRALFRHRHRRLSALYVSPGAGGKLHARAGVGEEE